MARRVRNGSLETRTQRLKLPVAKKPVFVRIGAGLSLGYRRNQAAGTWVMRVANGVGGAKTVSIGFADDHVDADGQQFFNFWQAQDRARAVARHDSVVPGFQPLTVSVASENYLQWLTAKNPRTAADARGRLKKHFLPKFGSRQVSALTKTMLESWLAGMVSTSNDPERVRKSKDSANRVLTMVKALLNHAIGDKANRLTDDSAWRLVKPFQKVSKPRDIRYTDDEVRRLVSAGKEDIGCLLSGAYLTGARYGELANALVAHFDFHTQTLAVNVGKTGARTVILQSAAARFLASLTSGREPEEFIFIQENGRKWKRSDQTRPVKEALQAAKLPANGCIYALRHTYISHAIEGEVPLNIIAENCGTSVRMIEKTYAKILAEKRRKFIERGAPTL